jgi:predicted TIM-barrel fold metal-dependent hydrolase
MVLGADAPPLNPLLPRALALVQGLDLPAAEKEGILGLNTLRLLGLPTPRPS